MAAIKPLFFFLSTLFLISIPSSSSSNDFDMYQVNLQWNPATCSDKDLSDPCYKVPSDKFSVSSLWPIISSPFQVLGPCEGTKFNPNAISSIQFSLRQKWPDIISGKDEELWKKEWESHGTCSEDYLKQVEYFGLAINSATSHNLLRILDNNGVTPTDRLYWRSSVVEPLERAIGVRPAVRCNMNRLSGTEQLHEIGLCYTKEREMPIDCPVEATTCGDRFEWFPYMRSLYGYFRVGFQWEPATCFSYYGSIWPCFQNPELRFSLNSVRPTRRTHHPLRHCSNTTFDINKISPIRERLDQAWPDLRQRRNDVLWRREWVVHGTCSEDLFGQLEYFSFGLHAFETNDILGMLRRNNITPNGQVYTKQEVENAIISSIGVKPYVVCNPMEDEIRWQLHQIILCYDEKRQTAPGLSQLSCNFL